MATRIVGERGDPRLEDADDDESEPRARQRVVDRSHDHGGVGRPRKGRLLCTGASNDAAEDGEEDNKGARWAPHEWESIPAAWRGDRATRPSSLPRAARPHYSGSVSKPSLRLLVAVHDVTPAHARRLEVLYHLLDELGVRRYALLVVPNWHGSWPLVEYPDFVAQLRERAANGAEILLHGWRHDEVGLPRSLAHRLRTFGRTDREGEFASLTPVEAAARIARGLAALRGAGLEPLGFVPPAWLAGPTLPRVVREEGLTFTEDAHAVVALNGQGQRIAAPATCWSTRRSWRAAGSVVVASLRLRLERARPLVRVALHPPDADVPAVLASCRRTLVALLERRRLTTYRELLLEERSRVAAR
ncbi:MAG: hypothetical protein DMD67_00200 [Gemmatimonadetes bacterium]|nr:MAG: hypothetical protein DMD67_00200 [Gemmatimonadota bacterium]